MKQQRGIALVNALILVAALAGVAVFLLQKAEQGRLRLDVGHEAVQAGLYLDGFEDLLALLLRNDWQRGQSDHMKESWTLKDYQVRIDRGVVRGDVVDLNGRFNLNWMAFEEDTAASEAFLRLANNLNISSALAAKIVEFISEGGPVSKQAYSNRRYPILPKGGEVQLLDQLRLVDGMTERAFEKLSNVLCALPADRGLNVNTTPPEVLSAVLPSLSVEAAEQLLALRDSEPFALVSDFTDRVQHYLGEEESAASEVVVFTVTSHWFEAEISASLGETVLARRVIMKRRPNTGRTRVEYRLSVAQ
ncbi:MAG: type II secretion system minor pseudopilin GspK [Rhodobacteraceae bacterium]|nr:type II secretion system minor pseudopilin GspK [Paracoccaceae bacterium]